MLYANTFIYFFLLFLQTMCHLFYFWVTLFSNECSVANNNANFISIAFSFKKQNKKWDSLIMQKTFFLLRKICYIMYIFLHNIILFKFIKLICGYMLGDNRKIKKWQIEYFYWALYVYIYKRLNATALIRRISEGFFKINMKDQF
jgi:hypothetical protein